MTLVVFTAVVAYGNAFTALAKGTCVGANVDVASKIAACTTVG